MKEESCPRKKIKVIVRAWGDEPVALFLHHVDNKHAYVGSEHFHRVIGLPVEQVYLFDSTTFSGLRSAFESRDTNKLVSTYSELAVNSPCNRYQDVLELVHDKENITDSGSVADSSEQ